MQCMSMSGLWENVMIVRGWNIFLRRQEGEAIPHRYDKIEKGRSKENRLEIYCVLQPAKDHHDESERFSPCDLSRTV